MLKLSETFKALPVMSLRTTSQVATVIEPIINPNNLRIEGWYCQDSLDKSRLVLLSKDIRDLLPQGFIVDDHEVLTEPEELVRLREVIDIAFVIDGKPVVTVNGNKLGKVNDYAVETTGFMIQKIYVGQSLLKSLSGGNLSIDRSQITEITPRKIVVQDLVIPATERVTTALPLNPA